MSQRRLSEPLCPVMPASPPSAPAPAPPFGRSAQTSFAVLVVDDDEALHRQYRQMLGNGRVPASSLEARTDDDSAAEMFGRLDLDEALPPRVYQTTHAYDGDEALEFVRAGILGGSHFAVAFVDMIMPGGLDGIETTRKLWAVDPAIQVVLCTTYADFSWQETIERVGRGDGLHLLRKPFKPGQVSRFIDTLCKKWILNRARVTPWALSG